MSAIVTLYNKLFNRPASQAQEHTDLLNHPAWPTPPAGTTTRIKCREHGVEEDCGDAPIITEFLPCHCRPVWPGGHLTGEVEIIERSPACTNVYPKYTHSFYFNIFDYAAGAPETIFQAAFIAALTFPAAQAFICHFTETFVTASYSAAFWALDDYLCSLPAPLTEDEGKALGHQLNRILRLFTSTGGLFGAVRAKGAELAEVINRMPKHARDHKMWGHVEYEAARDLLTNWFTTSELDEMFAGFTDRAKRSMRGFSNEERAHLVKMVKSFTWDANYLCLWRSEIDAHLFTSVECSIFSGMVYGNITAGRFGIRLTEEESRALIRAINEQDILSVDASRLPGAAGPMMLLIQGRNRFAPGAYKYLEDRLPLGNAHDDGSRWARFLAAGWTEPRAEIDIKFLSEFQLTEARPLTPEMQEWIRAYRRARNIVVQPRAAWELINQMRADPTAVSPRTARAFDGWTRPSTDTTFQEFLFCVQPTYATDTGHNQGGRRSVVTAMRWAALVFAASGWDTRLSA